MKKSQVFLILVIIAILALIICLLVLMNLGKIPVKIVGQAKVRSEEKIDDWCYEQKKSTSENYGINYNSADLTKSFSVSSGTGSSSILDMADSSTETMGYSVGGAKDINNFRKNIEEGYFPLETDITYEGVFYDYSFDTGNSNSKKSDKLFYPSYSTAISKDPISGKDEYYASVGLNSNIKESDFSRKNLNLVLVLDISGSMSSSISDYYYDNNEDEEKSNKSKMTLAEESINILLDQLNPDDSVGLVLFDDQGYIAKPLNLVGETDISAIKNHILEVKAQGGTNFEEGYKLANKLFDSYDFESYDDYENRIIVITDAMPNIGETSDEGLRKLMESDMKKGIYTTFIGVGVDFNTDVVKNITDVKGANYYSVSSEEEFNKRMGEEFEYMVTPMVFDLDMSLESNGFEIEKIYGTDSISSEKENIMHVNTLFPSKTNSNGEVKGGIILLKLKKIKDDAKDFKLKVSYVTRDGKEDSDEEKVEFKDSDEYYDNTGIRKGILLSRYVNLIKNWIEYERYDDSNYLITPELGMLDYVEKDSQDDTEDDEGFYYWYSNENERNSVKLSISEEYWLIFSSFKDYMNDEIKEIGDDDLKQEIEILDKILEA